MTEPTTYIYFRRREFYGDYQTRSPRWHVHEDDLPSDRGTFRAPCGYTYGNHLGKLLISRSTAPKPKGDMCAKCARKIASATPDT